tara:strand:- start:1842 stop:3194 length:1353 start_codon:yes stop_codon:yes gene_type:complete
MNKQIKYFGTIFITIFLMNCSFDDKTGIWSGSKAEKERLAEIERQQKNILETVKVYSSDKEFKEEILGTTKAKLTSSQKKSSWPMSGSNLQNFTINNHLNGVKNVFLKKKIGKNKFSISKLISSPIILEDNIIFSDDKGNVFNINKRGKIKWKKNVYKKIYKKIYKNLTFSIYNNKVYVADNVGFFYALNLNNGKLVWLKNQGVSFRSKIKIYENKIFLVDQDNRIFCFNAETGSKIWDIRSITTFIKSQGYLGLAISKTGSLFILNSTGDLIKVDTNTGQTYWSLNTTGSMSATDNDFFQSSDIVIDEEDMFFGTKVSLASYNVKSGYLNWIKEINTTSTPIINLNNVFVITDNGFFINLEKNSGNIIWSTNILKILKKKKQNTKITGFVLGSDKIYATSLNGYLIVMSAITGKVEGFKKIGDTITASPIIHNSSLYILTENSRIIGFK